MQHNKINRNRMLVCLATLACLSTSGFAADNDYNKAQTDHYKSQLEYRKGQPTTSADAIRHPITATPTKVNKASGLIGMEVKNQSDEKLGTIKDLVVDLNSAKVSYVVVDSGGLFKNKLFAVPLSAFKADTLQSHLVLNADKRMMETAKGFDRDLWPDVSDPVWGAEPFWERTPGTDRILPDRLQPENPSQAPDRRQDQDRLTTPPPSK